MNNFLLFAWTHLDGLFGGLGGYQGNYYSNELAKLALLEGRFNFGHIATQTDGDLRTVDRYWPALGWVPLKRSGDATTTANPTT